MNLVEALGIVRSLSRVSGQSDKQLISKVAKSPEFVAPSKRLAPAEGLTRGVSLRPVEVLHELSLATRPLYQDDLFDQYMQWGLLRYLGFFDVDPSKGQPQLRLSEVATRIVGNQRGVTSEDMGIGFGVHLARRWFTSTGATGASIGVIDVDVALRDGFVTASGVKRAVRQVSSNTATAVRVCRGRLRVVGR